MAFDPLPDGRVRVTSFCPFEFAVESDDLLIDDIRDADKVVLRVPLTNNQGTVWYGRRVYTPDEAYIESHTGEKRGIFNAEGTNPYGRIPLVGVRTEDAPKGWWEPRLPLDKLSAQIGLIIALSDMEGIARLKAADWPEYSAPSSGSPAARSGAVRPN